LAKICINIYRSAREQQNIAIKLLPSLGREWSVRIRHANMIIL
jgi:hypothetical protein